MNALTLGCFDRKGAREELERKFREVAISTGSAGEVEVEAGEKEGEHGDEGSTNPISTGGGSA